MDSKAAIHTNFGKKLTVGNVQIPDPRPDQVLVKLHSSGICHSQLHQMHNPDSPTPSLLGEPNMICKNNITFFFPKEVPTPTWTSVGERLYLDSIPW